MNLQRLAPALMGILLGSVFVLSADRVAAQPQEAYRYNWIQKFIVANKFIFGADINKSFLYAYDPSALQDMDLGTLCGGSEEGNTRCEWHILRPAPRSGWWAETPYQVIPIQQGFDTPSGQGPGDGSETTSLPGMGDGDLLAVNEKLDNSQFSDIFVIDHPGTWPAGAARREGPSM